MVVVMAIFVFVITAVFGIFLSVVQSQRRVISEQQLLSQVSYIQEYMSKALRMATVDTSGSCLGSNNIGYIYLLTRYNTTSGLFQGIRFYNQTDDTCEEFFLDNTTNPYVPVLKELKSGAYNINLCNSGADCKSGFNCINNLCTCSTTSDCVSLTTQACSQNLSQNFCLPISTALPNDARAIAITSSDLKLNYIKFSINGSSGGVFGGASCNNSPVKCGASNTDVVQPKVTMAMNVAISGGSNKIFQITVSQRNLNVNNGQRP